MTTVVLEKPSDEVDGEALEQGRIGVKQYVLILLQLGLLTLLLRQFQIESAAFLRLALMAFGGFAIHAWLPLRYRQPFFLVLSLVGIVLVLDIAHGVSIIAIGLVLIGICHLPIPFRARAILLVLVGALLVALRAKWVRAPLSDAIWPILGSMFMFRLIIYFYDLRHDTTPVSPVRTLCYFFMLPNACFPLFPVVDYKAFRRNYFDDDAYRTYQVGVDWMVRGVIHLILYRFIYYHVTLAPSEVTGPAQLLQYLVANFLLYLRVSGLFHLVVGMLYLFGFRLPETHNRYLLASSFTDFWRRINIYWKDFMQKDLLLPGRVQAAQAGDHQGDGAGDAVRIRPDLVPARLSVVLVARDVAPGVAGRPVLDDPRRAGRRKRALRDQARPRPEPRQGGAYVAQRRSARLENLRDVLVHLRAVVILDRRVGASVAVLMVCAQRHVYAGSAAVSCDRADRHRAGQPGPQPASQCQGIRVGAGRVASIPPGDHCIAGRFGGCEYRGSPSTARHRGRNDDAFVAIRTAQSPGHRKARARLL